MRTRGLALGVAGLALAGCGGGLDEPRMPESVELTSPAFAEGARIPAQFTCFGEKESPPLTWTGVPSEAKSLVLEVQDPDAPGDTYVHWLVVDIPPHDATLAAGHAPQGSERENSDGRTGWTPPCPPSGTHHYRFTIYALDVGFVSDADADDISNVIDQHLVGWGELTGTVKAG